MAVFIPSKLKDAFYIEYIYLGDNRGDLEKKSKTDIYKEADVQFSLNETIESASQKNIIRGLLLQKNHPQAKLVNVWHGRVRNVIIDLRPISPTLKKWEADDLSRKNHKVLYVLNVFVVLENDTGMLCQCEVRPDKESDSGVRIDDLEMGSECQIDLNTDIYLKRDLKLESFAEYCTYPINIGRGYDITLIFHTDWYIFDYCAFDWRCVA